MVRVDCPLTPLAGTDDGKGIWFNHKSVHSLAAWPDRELLREVIERVSVQARLSNEMLPDRIRTRSIGDANLFFNVNSHVVALSDTHNRKFMIARAKISAGEQQLLNSNRSREA
jgi:hypothetical protein